MKKKKSSTGLWGKKSKYSHLSLHCLHKNSGFVRLHCEKTTKYIHKLIITFQPTLIMPCTSYLKSLPDTPTLGIY